jgi:hypothetical protein
MKKIIFTLVALLHSPGSPAATTADWYKCTGRVGGEWNYGRVPSACDASAFGEDRVVTSTYPKQIFLDIAARDPERRRYMEEVHAVIRDAAEYYIRKRKPNVGEDEVKQWVFSILVVAAQETRISHYRKTTSDKLKMIRGDVGHGHGLMQIDDRSHLPVIDRGIAWNLISNITYGMDVYFAAWERAPSQSCVKNAASFWEARTRSAWSAYNGGPSRICRWADPNNAHAAKDKQFYDMYRNRTWRTYIADERKPASVDVPCLVENLQNCPPPGAPPVPSPIPVSGKLYAAPEGQYCVFTGGVFRCVAEFRDALCLNSLVSISSPQATNMITEFTRLPRTMEDRHGLCRRYDSSLHPVGAFVEFQQNIYVRSVPGGGQLGVARIGEIGEVLDFEVRNHPGRDRYYKIRVGGMTGFVYSGQPASQTAWVTLSDRVSAVPSQVMRPGEHAEIVNTAGINLRATPGGTLRGNIPRGTRVTIEKYTVRGSDNNIYYLVTHRGVSGYIYGGQTLPQVTTQLWLKRAD